MGVGKEYNDTMDPVFWCNLTWYRGVVTVIHSVLVELSNVALSSPCAGSKSSSSNSTHACCRRHEDMLTSSTVFSNFSCCTFLKE